MTRKGLFAMAAGAAATLLLGGYGATAAQADKDKPLSAMDKMFMRKASQGNMAEVMTSQLALKKSKDEKVTMIANMLIKEHGVAQKDLKSVAQLHQFSLPAGTDPKHRAMYRKLSGMSGASFDKMYMTGQVRDHNATVALFKNQLEKGSDTHVRSFAQKYLPGIENHTKMIHDTASNLGIKVAEPKMMGKMGAGAMKGMR